jgi:hypothetical protein
MKPGDWRVVTENGKRVVYSNPPAPKKEPQELPNWEEEFAVAIFEAWGRYTNLFGGPPHGTLKQIRALLELGVTRKLKSFISLKKKEWEQAAESSGIKAGQELQRSLELYYWDREIKRGISEARAAVLKEIEEMLKKEMKAIIPVNEDEALPPSLRGKMKEAYYLIKNIKEKILALKDKQTE